VYKKTVERQHAPFDHLSQSGSALDICLPLCKKDRENIAPDELATFKKLAKDYASASDAKIAALLNAKELLEICHDD